MNNEDIPTFTLTVTKTTAIRQAIIDLCQTKITTVNDMAIALNMNSKHINHHLIALIKEGYLHKHTKYVIINRAYANGYSTIKHGTYSNASTKENLAMNKTERVIDYEHSLMIKLGYTNIKPQAGRVHRGFMTMGA